MSRRAWLEAGARVIIKRTVRRGLAARGMKTDLTGAPFDLVLDLARTTYVDEFVVVAAEWRQVAEAMHKKFVGTPYYDEIAKARLMVEQVNLAEEVVRDLEAKL